MGLRDRLTTCRGHLGTWADLLWSPVVETFQLFLSTPLMPRIKHRYLELGARHSPHISKLGTNVVVALLQVLHRPLL